MLNTALLELHFEYVFVLCALLKTLLPLKLLVDTPISHHGYWNFHNEHFYPLLLMYLYL